MKKKIIEIKYLFAVSLVLFFIFVTSFNISWAEGLLNPDAAQKIKDTTGQIEQESGYQSATSVGDVIAIVIKGFLSLLSLIFIILIIVAGFNWMTAGGDEDKVRKAKDTLQRAVVGLAIVLSAYVITYFVFEHLSEITSL